MTARSLTILLSLMLTSLSIADTKNAPSSRPAVKQSAPVTQASNLSLTLPGQQPRIIAVLPAANCVQPGTEIQVKGNNFPLPQNHKIILVSRARNITLNHKRWNNNLISATIANNIQFSLRKSYPVAIFDTSSRKIISNQDIKLTICNDSQQSSKVLFEEKPAQQVPGNNATGESPPAQCLPLTANCDSNLTNGCETNLATDSLNCGSCGNTCPRKYSCIQGACVDNNTIPPSCSTGTANCDGNNNNGCEATTSTDNQNCGGCGNVCATGQQCVAGACINEQVSSCATGTADCDAKKNNGCEISLSYDNQNCGTCGTSCATGTSCLQGSCEPNANTEGCAPGFAKCGFIQMCVTDIMNDMYNCGGCGVRCDNGQSCNNGVCQ